VKHLKAGMPALPWILYNEQRINVFQLIIIDNKYIDQAWSPASIIYEDSSLFFKEGTHVDTFLGEVMGNSIGIHWHNQWKVRPEDDSPYQRLVEIYESGFGLDTSSIMR
jgi:hypothetical protein